MLATVGMKPTLHQRVKLALVALFFMLSLALGVATSTHRVGATLVCYQDPGRGKVCEKAK
jgi:hypothetical protein